MHADGVQTGHLRSASKANPMPHRSQLAPRSSSRNASPSVPTWNARSAKEEVLKAEVEKLREQLKQANLEKSEINSEYQKLSTICRSQRQQLHGIKQALASTTPPNKTASKIQHQVSMNGTPSLLSLIRS
ncbi:hypothetical protein L2E82_30471 [Cichorium intybus]|uniref:Uncharacterized protein n=1 Tax=Cichorium intybus TaxID=13427 RepID=A0ACB9D0H0_CICIN|nr:hypothetical protein L2E82_30471 [Cichorium intybus]